MKNTLDKIRERLIKNNKEGFLMPEIYMEINGLFPADTVTGFPGELSHAGYIGWTPEE